MRSYNGQIGGHSGLLSGRKSAAQRRKRNMTAEPIHSHNPKCQMADLTKA
jgi:hypothetical protein